MTTDVPDFIGQPSLSFGRRSLLGEPNEVAREVRRVDLNRLTRLLSNPGTAAEVVCLLLDSIGEQQVQIQNLEEEVSRLARMELAAHPARESAALQRRVLARLASDMSRLPAGTLLVISYSGKILLEAKSEEEVTSFLAEGVVAPGQSFIYRKGAPTPFRAR
jgi:hypothetical protein